MSQPRGHGHHSSGDAGPSARARTADPYADMRTGSSSAGPSRTMLTTGSPTARWRQSTQQQQQQQQQPHNGAASSSRQELAAKLAARMQQLEQRIAAHSSAADLEQQVTDLKTQGFIIQQSASADAQKAEQLAAEAKAEKQRIRNVISEFEPLLRGPQVDPDRARSYSLSRTTWLDIYAGRRPFPDLRAGGAAASGDGAAAHLPPPEPVPQPKAYPRLRDVRFGVLGGLSLTERGISDDQLFEIAKTLDDLAREKAEQASSGGRREGGPAGPSGGAQQQQQQRLQRQSGHPSAPVYGYAPGGGGSRNGGGGGGYR